MSHLDELDEFEADLELQLKKEYAAVFPLFRYCVLTPDTTYLCNKVELQPRIQPAYPLFEVEMEDVWVWDKNRPSRIIPRTRDLHLRRCHRRGAARRGRRPAADRRGARRADRRDARRRRRQLIRLRQARLAACCSRSTSATPRPSSASSTATASRSSSGSGPTVRTRATSWRSCSAPSSTSPRSTASCLPRRSRNWCTSTRLR